MLVGANPAREWPLLCRALNRSDWLSDSRFGDIREVMQHREEVKTGFGDAFGQLTTAQAMIALDEVDATYSMVEPLRDVVTDAQLIENDVIIPTGDDDPDYQWTVNSPIEVADIERQAIQRAPELGADSEEILAEFGITTEAIETLRSKGVLASS